MLLRLLSSLLLMALSLLGLLMMNLNACYCCLLLLLVLFLLLLPYFTSQTLKNRRHNLLSSFDLVYLDAATSYVSICICVHVCVRAARITFLKELLSDCTCA